MNLFSRFSPITRKVSLWMVTLLFVIQSSFCDWRDLLRDLKDKNSSSSIESIDFIYMINLDRRPSRWKQSSRKLKVFDIFPYRVSAIDGWIIPEDTLKDHGIAFLPRGHNPWGSPLSRGGLGATLSHLSVIRDALLSDYDMVWVMEDDINILSDPNQLKDLITKLDQLVPDWEVLYTDYGPSRPNNKAYKQVILSEDFMQQTLRFGCYSFLIKKSGLKKIWDYFLAEGIRYPIDDEFNLVPDLVRVCLRKKMISYLILGSDTRAYLGPDLKKTTTKITK